MKKGVKYEKELRVTSFKWSSETRELLKSMIERYGRYSDTYDSFLNKALKILNMLMEMLDARDLDDCMEKLKQLQFEEAGEG